jgi:SAM-dependent methyltransferase
MIDYNHSQNLHTTKAPAAIAKIILEMYQVSSVLDVGCGTGVWLQEFIRLDVKDVYGIDGIPIENREFSASRDLFRCVDLRGKWDLKRNFDLAICLEVAEHLPQESAHDLIRSLCAHSKLIIFSAACPNQGGQGHINCQWPAYWQEIFNINQYSCSDPLRPRIWQEEFPEYWYKQNMFVAFRDPANAGQEARLAPLVHPQLLKGWVSKWESQNALIGGKNGLRSSASQAIQMLANAASSAISRRVHIND